MNGLYVKTMDTTGIPGLRKAGIGIQLCILSLDLLVATRGIGAPARDGSPM